MQMRRAVITGITILIVCGMLVSTTAMDVTILIDGDFSDWNGLEPVFTEEEVHPDYWLDIQRAFIVADETTLFVRIDYEAPLDYWASLMTNITLRTPSNEVFILMYQIVYDSLPHRSTTWIFHGINLSSYLNHQEYNTQIAIYQNSTAISSSNTSVEYYYPLSDLGLMLNDTIDVTFWHYDSVSAGEYSVVLHKIAGTVYQISLKQTINESLITTTSNTGMTSTDRVIFGIDMFILFVILVPILRRKRN